jgi:uncharacterized protein YdhG (YjbR/CyaY superfamily)
VVQSSALTVDAYFADLPADRAEAMHRIRRACVAQLAGWEERMQWGMPGYGPPGSDAVISFNSQKGYISLYIGNVVLEKYRGQLKKASLGKSCIRYKKPTEIDFDLVDSMLADAFRAKSSAC